MLVDPAGFLGFRVGVQRGKCKGLDFEYSKLMVPQNKKPAGFPGFRVFALKGQGWGLPALQINNRNADLDGQRNLNTTRNDPLPGWLKACGIGIGMGWVCASRSAFPAIGLLGRYVMWMRIKTDICFPPTHNTQHTQRYNNKLQ